MFFSSLQYSLFLRDLVDYLATRKVREVTDFEWRRYLRFYVQDIGICCFIFIIIIIITKLLYCQYPRKQSSSVRYLLFYFHNNNNNNNNNNHYYKTSISPISSKTIELSGAPSTGIGQTHSPGTMQSNSS